MLKKVAFTLYPVRDTARARKFYEETLGLAVGSHSASGTWTEYDLPGGGCLALFNNPRGSAGAPAGPGGPSIAFEVDDLTALVARLRSEGVTIQQDDIVSPVCRMAIVLDSEGNSIILHQLHPK